MIQTNRLGKNYSDNLLDSYLTFDTTGTWSVSSGTGSGAHSEDYVFQGERSLKIQNTAPTTDLTITNATQNTVIGIKTGSCILSFYMRKENSSDAYTGNVKIFKNAVLEDTQTWSLADTQDGEWYRFISDMPYDLVETDVITFTFTFDGDAGFVGSKTVYIDGMMLYNTERLDSSAAPPIYTAPPLDLNVITTAGATTTNDVSFGNVTATQFKLSALNTAPASASSTGTTGEVRIVADYIYVCTTTDTWVRAALSTW